MADNSAGFLAVVLALQDSLPDGFLDPHDCYSFSEIFNLESQFVTGLAVAVAGCNAFLVASYARVLVTGSEPWSEPPI
jgi:hypothetical protein